MTEFSVGDRVLVPGKISGFNSDGEYDVTYASGMQRWHYPTDLRPDTGGRDLTSHDVRDAFRDAMHQYPQWRAVHELVAERLTRIARGDAGAGDDTAPPAVDRAIQPVDWARREVMFLAREVCEYRGSEIGGKKLDQLAVAITTLDEKVAERRAAAGPRAGDTRFSPDADSLNQSPRGSGDTAPAGPEPIELAEKLCPVLDHLIAQVIRDDGDPATLRNRAAVELAKVAIEHRTPRAGDTAPADESLLPHAEVTFRVAAETHPGGAHAAIVAELNRLRSDAAALRTAGNPLADRALKYLHDQDADVERELYRSATAWRSAAGGAQQ